MPFSSFLEAVHCVVHEKRGLTEQEAQQAMRFMLQGEATPVLISAFLIGLRMKGETVEEVTGLARAMREAAKAFQYDLGGEPLLDTCGTGGKHTQTFNISTTAAFVIAGGGVRVAKHGNRSLSHRSGSADLLEALGISVFLSAEQCALAMEEVGIGFLFAPYYHSATRHVQPVRKELKLRTIFNLLGPLTNPAGATAQIAGAYSVRAAELIAGSLAALGLQQGFVFHGSDGLDEVTTTGPTEVFSIRNGTVHQSTITPEEMGLLPAQLSDLRGGDPVFNAEITRDVLGGKSGPERDIVVANAAWGFLAAAKTTDLKEAVDLAKQSIDSGAAQAKLHQLCAFSAPFANASSARI